MNQFLRNSSISSRRNSLIRILCIGTAGLGLLYANSNPDSKTRLSLSIPVPVPWQTQQALIPRPSFLSLDNWQFGNLPLFSSRVSLVPSTDIKKESSGEVGDGPKPCCRCRDTIANAAARVAPAVVKLSVHECFHGITNRKSRGSGTIIDSDGTILTCAYVPVNTRGMRGYRKVDVTLHDGQIFTGTIVNTDLHSNIGIVKIKSKTPLPTAKLGSSSKLRPGDSVVAIGSPRSLQNTITTGIVSYVDRKSTDMGDGGMQKEYLQTDCAINKGNSGGPIVNIDGEVVGVIIKSTKDAEGLHFAVPIDSVSKVIEHFKKNGRVVRPWLGLKMLDLNEMIISQLKEKDATFPNVNKGVLVPMVTPGSPADRAGFCPGDVILEFDRKPIASTTEIVEIMGDRIGVPLKVVVKRANDSLTTLTVIPEESNPNT